MGSVLARSARRKVVIGGFNPAQHVSSPLSARRRSALPRRGTRRPSSRHRYHPPPPVRDEVRGGESGWLPEAAPVRIGVTAGASTPNNKIGDAVARIFATRGTARSDRLTPPRRHFPARSRPGEIGQTSACFFSARPNLISAAYKYWNTQGARWRCMVYPSR